MPVGIQTKYQVLIVSNENLNLGLLFFFFYNFYLILRGLQNHFKKFGGDFKITANGDCSHEIKRRLLLGRKVMTNLDTIFKSRDITLPTKVCLVKAMVFPVVMDVRVGL